MPDLLYLDTARLGRMSPAAQRAQHDFASLAGEEGGSAYLERFVRHGLTSCPVAMQTRYPGLARWQGVAELKQALRTLAGHRPDLPLLVAHRSAQLMKLAARLLFHPCRNVLTTDLDWPGYRDILEQEARRASRRVTTVAVRDAVLRGHLGESELVERVSACFAREECDGLFLTAVSNWGVRVPTERIVRHLEAAHRLWFVVIDGAQEFCHTPGRLETEYCDLYLTGCHKWLAAYHPMGLGFYGRRRSRGVVDTIAAHMTQAGDLDDPLLRFSGQLESDAHDGANETVNLTPLFTARGAVEDAGAEGALCRRVENLDSVAALAPAAGWCPLRPEAALHSAILLLEAERKVTRSASPQLLHSALRERGVAATVYPGGLLRLSMPPLALTTGELDGLSGALKQLA